MIILVDYQDKAVKKSLKEIQEVLDSPERRDESRKFLLQAPTGSGKTIMASSIVRGMAGLEGRDFAFVFMAPNTLHTQSKASFEQHLEGENVMFLGSLPTGALEKNSILFLNWASVNKAKNKMIADREDERTIAAVMEKTRDMNRDIIFIIDESHHSASSTISKEFISTVSPRLIFEISATPKSDFTADDFADKVAARVKVAKDDVIASGIICKGAVFGQDYEAHEKTYFAKFGKGNADPNELYVWAALQERTKFEGKLSAESEDFTPAYIPAVGIQLPSQGNAGQEVKDTKEELSQVDALIDFLIKCGIHREEIAVYLSGRKENMDEKNMPLAEVKVVIFKTAIAVGWDFPRLKVGALLRETKTKSFAVQTLGRWMRQPERKQYANEYLNNAYFYTDVELMPAAANDDIVVSLAKTTTLRPKFKESVAQVQLTSVNRLPTDPIILDTSYFAKNWVKALKEERNTPELSAKELFHAMGFTSSNEVLGAVTQIGNYTITNIDAVQTESGSTTDYREDNGFAARRLSNHETEAEFEKVVHDVLSYHKVSNADNIISHILTSIARVTGLTASTVARVIKADGHLETFANMVGAVVVKFKTENADVFKDNSSFEEVTWTPTETAKILYSKDGKTGFSKNEPVQVSENSRYVYDFAPALGRISGKGSDLEKEYFDYLESVAAEDEVKWFVKNGDQGSEHFSILYDKPVTGTNRTVKTLYYPDWIILRTDGSIDIQDTKSGMTMQDGSTLPKLQAAVNYCKALSTQLGITVRSAMVTKQAVGGMSVFVKSKPGVTNLAEDDFSNWESIF